MSIDLDSFPLLNYEKDREGPESPQTKNGNGSLLIHSPFYLKEIKLALEPWAGRPGLSLLLCSRHEKDARKRYAQRAEDPLRVCLGKELYDLFPYCIEKKKRSVLRPPIVGSNIDRGRAPTSIGPWFYLP